MLLIDWLQLAPPGSTLLTIVPKGNNEKRVISYGIAIVKDGLPTSTQQDTRSFPALWLAMPQSKSLRNWLATQQVVSPSIDTATQLHMKSLTH